MTHNAGVTRSVSDVARPRILAYSKLVCHTSYFDSAWLCYLHEGRGPKVHAGRSRWLSDSPYSLLSLLRLESY
jgi:hypothetical protein